ncbi:unnamed protein product [Rotaria socialis]|uniref:Uncharacterized protein n=2 Tax=Rotaria socialis TaxID=392032 RepID=A0A820TJK8_9BILA|nr:unnamed protein product [Rotaria socialis]
MIYCSALAQLDQLEDFLVKQKQFQTNPYTKHFQTNHPKIGRTTSPKKRTSPATSPTTKLVQQLLQQQNWSSNFSNDRFGRTTTPTADLVFRFLRQKNWSNNFSHSRIGRTTSPTAGKLYFQFQLYFILFRFGRTTSPITESPEQVIDEYIVSYLLGGT